MTTLAWIALGGWVWGLTNTILNLWLIPRLRRDAPVEGPLVSVIVPARDEERAIGSTTEHLLAQTYRNLEVIVVNDRSTDRTAEILESIQRTSEPERLRVLNGEEPPPRWLGKPWALHQGSRVARGELLLFVDADLQYEPPAVAGAVDHLLRSRLAMTTLLPRFVCVGFWENVLMPFLAVTVFCFVPTWLANRTRIRLLGIGGGTGNLIRREVYESFGGHAALRAAVVDDVGLAQRVRADGGRTTAVLADDAVSLRMYHGAREIVDGFTKNIFSVFNRSYVALLLSGVAGISFHVFPYVHWLATWSTISLATIILITISRLLLFTALRYSILSALFAHPLMVGCWTLISFRSAWVTGIRRKVRWRGRDYDTDRTAFGADR